MSGRRDLQLLNSAAELKFTFSVKSGRIYIMISDTYHEFMYVHVCSHTMIYIICNCIAITSWESGMYFELASSHNCVTLYGNLDMKKLVLKK